MGEIDLMKRYPRSKRPIGERGLLKLSSGGWAPSMDRGVDNTTLMLEQRMLSIAREFGREYFDGDRLYGYGGYYYDPRYWTKTVRLLRDHYKLSDASSVLDVGCAKGYLLYDFKKLLPGLRVAGLDVSRYAVDHSMDEMKPFLTVGNAKALPYPDKSFDLVVSINTVDHLPLEECRRALKEIERVAKKHAFISVNAWKTEKELERQMKWNVTAKTCLHVKDWKKVFKEAGYRHDYWWFTA